MIADLDAARPVAGQTLTGRVALVALGVDVWDEVTDRLIRGLMTIVWEGPASLASPAGITGFHAGDARGDDDMRNSQILRLPRDAPVVIGQRVYLNPPHPVSVAALADMVPLIVTRLDTRTNTVLQRVSVSALTDADTLPR